VKAVRKETMEEGFVKKMSFKSGVKSRGSDRMRAKVVTALLEISVNIRKFRQGLLPELCSVHLQTTCPSLDRQCTETSV